MSGEFEYNPLQFLDCPSREEIFAGSYSTTFVKPEQVRFFSNTKDTELDIYFVRDFAIKPTGDESVVSDLLAFTDDRVIVSLQRPANNHGVRSLRMYDLHGNLKEDKKEEDVRRMTAVNEGKSMAQTNGRTIVINTRKQQGSTTSFSMDFPPGNAVQAIAAVNSNTLAAARDKQLVLLTDECGVSTTFERRCGENICFGPWCYPVIDMCALKDDKLLLFDHCGIHQINPYNGCSDLIEVSDMKGVTSVAAYDSNFLFACAPNNKLYLFGSDSNMVVKVWSLEKFLRKDDTLEHVSVFGKNSCVCSTNFGFLLILTITLKRASD